MRERVVHAHDRAHHDDDEEEEVGVDRAPEPAERGIDDGRDGRDQDDGPLVGAEERLADLDGGQHHQARRDHVEDDAEVDGPKSAQDRSGAAGVAQLVELDVALRARTHPQPRIDEHREHAREQERPPLPVLAQRRVADELREHVGGVGGSGRCAHGNADEPPGHRAPRKEEVLGVLARAPRAGRRNAHEQREEHADRGKVQYVHVHGLFSCRTGFGIAVSLNRNYSTSSEPEE